MPCPQAGVRSFTDRSCVTLENVGHFISVQSVCVPGSHWAVSLQGSTLVISCQDVEPSSLSSVHHLPRGSLRDVLPASQRRVTLVLPDL